MACQFDLLPYLVIHREAFIENRISGVGKLGSSVLTMEWIGYMHAFIWMKRGRPEGTYFVMA